MNGLRMIQSSFESRKYLMRSCLNLQPPRRFRVKSRCLTTKPPTDGVGAASGKNQSRWLYDLMVKKRSLSFHKFEFNISFSELAGHAGFVVLAKSYLESEPLVLRQLALGAFFSLSAFQYFRPQPLWLPLRWNAAFITINLGMILLILKDQKEAEHFPDWEEEIYQELFMPNGVSRPDFLNLMKIATRYEAGVGCDGCLAKQNQEQSKLCLITRGGADVIRDGKQIASLQKYQFFGEMSYIAYRQAMSARMIDSDPGDLSDVPKPKATADIVIKSNTELIVWNFDELYTLNASRPTLRNTFLTSIAHDLIDKLVAEKLQPTQNLDKIQPKSNLKDDSKQT